MSFYEVQYARAALVDIEEAVNYYEQRRSGLGLRFAEAVLEKVAAIATNPFHSRIGYDQIHCAKVNIFPYLIHYSVERDKSVVTIEAVWNTWRQPLWEHSGEE